jgi:hypothetical protein
MADLNALIAQGAQFNMPDQLGQYAKMQQLQQGQQQMRTAALQEQTASMQLDQLKQDRDNMAKLSQQLSVKGISPRQYFEALQTSGDPKHQQLGVEGLMKLDSTEKYDAFLKSQQTIPAAQAPAPMAGGMPAPVNALAPRAAVPVPSTNALATQAADPVVALETKIAQLRSFNDPRAQAEVARLQKQLDEYNKAHVVGGNLVTGAGKTLFTAPEKAAKTIGNINPGDFTPASLAKFNTSGSYGDLVLKPVERAPVQPQPPVAVVDPITGKQVLVSREEAISKRLTPAAAMESLPPKEIQKREAALPQATSAVQGFESKSDKFIADLKALRDDPGLENITGAIYGRTPSVTREGSRAQALYDKVVAKGGFQALQDLRDASKTGGALGNVSNQEGKQLTASFAAIDRRQNAEDVRAAIDQAISDIEGSKTRMREAYDSTYSYKSGGASAPAANAGEWKVIK